MRLGLAKVIDVSNELYVCGEHDRFEGLVDAVIECQPDALILDIGFPDGDGLDALLKLRKDGNDIPVLVVTSHDEKKLAARALRCGANGFVMKEEACKRVIAGLQAVLQGEIFLNDEIRNVLLSEMQGAELGDDSGEGGSVVDELTQREEEIFNFVGAGMSSKQIAEKLEISPSTVDVHKANIRNKLQLDSAPELLQKAIQYRQEKLQ